MSDKAYEDVSDADVAALAAERKAFRDGNRLTIPDGVYASEVKHQKALAEVPESGLFAGQCQTLLTHALLNEDGEQIPGAVVFNRLALPLAAAGKAASVKGRSIALNNVLKLQKQSDAEDNVAATTAALAAAKASADGETPFVGAKCFVRLETKSYTNKAGEAKSFQNVQIAEFLRKGEELSKLPSKDNSDMFPDIACADEML
jgi:hypothetical protein